MNKRKTFKCGNCQELFSVTRDLTNVRIFITECPFCAAKVQIDLTPFLSNAVEVFRGDSAANQEESLNLPDIIPTTPVQ